MKEYQVNFSADLNVSEGVLLDDFSFPWIERECPRTEFRAVWNEEKFCFKFDVDDADLVLNDSDDKDTAVLGSDRVELFFAADRELSGYYYGTEMDPRGWAYDYRAKTYRQIDDEWCFPSLVMEGSIRSDGYSLSGAIDLVVLKSLGLLRNGLMTTGVYRAEFSHGPDGIVEDWMPWVDPGTEAPDFHVPASFGRFVFKRG